MLLVVLVPVSFESGQSNHTCSAKMIRSEGLSVLIMLYFNVNFYFAAVKYYCLQMNVLYTF